MQRRKALAAVAALLTVAVPAAADAWERPVGQGVAQAYNESGQILFRKLSARSGNIVLSPLSVGTAMAMALAGARGETEREMAAVLRHRIGRDQIADASALVLSVLKAYDRDAVPPRCPPKMTLAGKRCEAQPDADGSCSFPAHPEAGRCIVEPYMAPSAKVLVANALMLSGGRVAADYEALLKEKYRAEVFHGASLDTVNGWVKRKTEGKIDRILEKLSDVTLVNAVYFKSRWALAFKKHASIDEFFSLSRSRQELVPMMQQRAGHVVVQRKGYRAIRLPYAVRSLGMIVALPDEVDGLDAVAAALDSTEFAQMRAALRKTPPRLTSLSLPRFRAEFTADLTVPFKKIGMQLPFDLRRADFSGITGLSREEAPSAIDQIVHRAVIDVAEESTEAAATTAIGVRVTSVMPKRVQPIHFRVDRPFLYYIVDEVTGAVLFQGRIVDPR